MGTPCKPILVKVRLTVGQECSRELVGGVSPVSPWALTFPLCPMGPPCLQTMGGQRDFMINLPLTSCTQMPKPQPLAWAWGAQEVTSDLAGFHKRHISEPVSHTSPELQACAGRTAGDLETEGFGERLRKAWRKREGGSDKIRGFPGTWRTQSCLGTSLEAFSQGGHTSCLWGQD